MRLLCPCCEDTALKPHSAPEICLAHRPTLLTIRKSPEDSAYGVLFMGSLRTHGAEPTSLRSDSSPGQAEVQR